MATSATRRIKIIFDGSAKGLVRATKTASAALNKFRLDAQKQVLNVGGGVMGALGSALAAAPALLKPAAIAAAVGLGGVMAPVLAGTIVSTILLAVGGGVLAAGIMGAAKDSRVQSAWKRFGANASKTFSRFSQPFIKPLVRAAGTFDKALRRAEPTIQRIGRIAAPFIDKLAPGIVGFIEKLLPGVERGTAAAGPFFELLAAHGPRLGDSITRMFDAFAKGSPGALRFFDRFLTFVEKAIPKTGEILTWITDMGVKFETFASSEGLKRTRDGLTALKDDVLSGLGSAWRDVSAAVDDNTSSWKTLKDAVNKAIEALGPALKFGLEQAGIQLNIMINTFAKLVTEIGKSVEGLRLLDELWRRWTGTDRGIMWKRTPPAGGRGDIEGFAKGGNARGWIMAGERGRELINLGAGGGRVYNNRDTEQMMGGGGGTTVIHNHIEIGGEVVRTVKTVVANENRQTRRRVLAGTGAR